MLRLQRWLDGIPAVTPHEHLVPQIRAMTWMLTCCADRTCCPKFMCAPPVGSPRPSEPWCLWPAADVANVGDISATSRWALRDRSSLAPIPRPGARPVIRDTAGNLASAALALNARVSIVYCPQDSVPTMVFPAPHISDQTITLSVYRRTPSMQLAYAVGDHAVARKQSHPVTPPGVLNSNKTFSQPTWRISH
jgi:hypothetical protein